jgi:hypothetical protein
MERDRRVPAPLKRCLLGFAALLAVEACQRSSLATPRRAPIIDLTANRQVVGVAETRRILFGDGDRSQLLDGWSVDERDPSLGLTFVWATALEASLSFQLLQVEDEQFLVKLSPFGVEPPQTITVLINGAEVSRFTAQPPFLEYRFVAPAAFLHRGENRLTFRHSELAGRADGLESRRFAAAYSSIYMGPQCLPLRGWGFPPRPRVRREGDSSSSRLVVIGPAAIRRRLRVPQAALLRYRLALTDPTHAAAIATLRIRDGDTTRDVVETRLSRSLFDRAPSRDVEVDLTPWKEKTVELELEVRPELCRYQVTRVVIERAGIYYAEHGRGDVAGEPG